VIDSEYGDTEYYNEARRPNKGNVLQRDQSFSCW